MTLFELTSIVLDKLYQQGMDKYGSAEVDGQVRKSLCTLSTSFGNLDNPQRQSIDYRDPATRMAYVHKYVTTHADYIVQGLQRLRRHFNGNIFHGESVRISCFGGGPGSDILAVLKYLSENEEEPVERLTCFLLDREEAWQDTWTEILESLSGGLQTNVSYQSVDVTQPATWQYKTGFRQADLIIFSYFLSEIFHEGPHLTEGLKDILGQMKSGAVLLYIDNNHPTFNSFFDEIWLGTGFGSLVDESHEWTPRATEEKTAIQPYIEKFGLPRLKGRLTLRVLQKN